MSKIISAEQALKHIKDEMTIMVGGFLAVGTPETLIDGIAQKDVKNITLVCNDTGFPDKGVGKLVLNKQVEKIYTSHIGTNPETGVQLNSGETTVILTPQGTLAEQIRAGGAGLGGFLTPTGVGTVVEQGKQKMTIAGIDYLLELPLRANVALIKAHKADKNGNLVYRKSARNFNPLMATAADIVIAEVSEIVEVGEIDPDQVMTPGILVDYLVREEQ
ncbi:acetate CoA-transferase subunit alpha [Clostridium sp. 'deep sea']|uniref:acetate CoA-transferase subunit alpha n=1 Tax=Clostridium sp. 'deep sea' TaxID=2779445 RepID=UPI0024342031|nr:acetate CoA-transferase subunit alpha [Clostridium sp. 'deep sea']